MRDNSALPLVLIGGTLCNARLWQPLIERLNVSSVLCVSLTGSTSTRQASRRLLDNLPPRFLLVGFSLGAMVALQIACDAPQRIAGLALISVNPLADRAENAPLRRGAVQTARERGLTSFISSTLWSRYVAPARREDKALHDTICLMAQECGLDTFAGHAEMAITRQDHRPTLSALTCPVQIVHGALDPICTPYHHQLVAASAVNAKTTTVPTAGHFVVLEAPDDVAPPLSLWIQECLHAS